MSSPLTHWPSLHQDHFRDQRVLVTGGAGFIGSHLVRALLELGAQVTVLDDLAGGQLSNLPTHQALRVIEGSILDIAVVTEAVAGSRYVFHQAALGSVPRSVREPDLFVQVNVQGTLRVLEASRQAGVQRLIFAASSSAYGDTPELPKIESMLPRPLSPYAATKLAGEHLLSAYAASLGLETLSLRYFNIFGPQQNANSAYAAVIAAFAKAMLEGRQPVVFGDGEQSRDFTYVDNAVHANLLAARASQPLTGQAVNIAAGRRITVNELAQQMAQLLGQPSLQPTYQPARAGDVLHSLADLTAARSLIDYEPIVEFSAGLRTTVEWYRDSLGQPAQGSSATS